MNFFKQLLKTLAVGTGVVAAGSESVGGHQVINKRDLQQPIVPPSDSAFNYGFAPLSGVADDSIKIQMPFEGNVTVNGLELDGIGFNIISGPTQELKYNGTIYEATQKISVMTYAIDITDVNKLEIEYSGSNFNIMLYDKSGDLRTELVAVDQNPSPDNNINTSKVVVSVNDQVIAGIAITNSPTAQPTAVPTTKPSEAPTAVPTTKPSDAPTATPTLIFSDANSSQNKGHTLGIIFGVYGTLFVLIGTAYKRDEMANAVSKLCGMISRNETINPQSIEGVVVIPVEIDRNPVADIEMGRLTH